MQENETVITPKSSEPIIKSLVKYRELVFFFTWREFKLRYRQATLGILWAVLQPAIFMLIVDFIISQRLGARFGDGTVPSFALIFLGFVLWQLFEPSLSNTINSFLNNQSLFKKLYFPRLIPAISFMTSRLLDFFIAFVLLFALSIFLGFAMPATTLLLVIPSLVVLLLTAYGAGLFLGALNLRYRDIKQVTPFFMRILFFATPIIWPLSVVPENLQPYLYLNPAAAVIETMRRSWYEPENIEWHLLLLPLITVTVCLILGVWMYKRRERDMVDIA